MRGSKTIRILKRKGIRFALAYRIRKEKYQTNLLILYSLFFQLNSPHKLHIYKILKRFHILNIYTPTLIFIAKYYEEIISWTESIEFKTKYLDTHHPYPPMLNPKRLNRDSNSPYPSLSYESISPKIAWDLNLPLPREYDSIWLYNSGSGGEAVQTFFHLCGVEFYTICWRVNEYKSAFLYLYKSYLQGKKVIFSLNNWQEGAEKFASLLDKKVPIFCIARDPISRLKTGVNHLTGESWNVDSFRHLTLKSKICFPPMYYRGALNTKPDINIITESSHFTLMPNEFGSITTRLNWLKNATSEVIFLPIDEISGKKTFETFVKLSHKLHFNPPTNPQIFEGKINRYEGLLMLPCVLSADTKENNENVLEAEVKVIITTQQLTPNTDKALVDVTLFFNIKMPQDNVILYSSKEDFAILKANALLCSHTKTYLQGYMNALEKYMHNIKAHLISEKDILAYFVENPSIAFAFAKQIQKDMTYIKQHRPDIIESWKYFKEFERLNIFLRLNLS
ncbi:DUF2972 domain-containing protein [Helicobacter sp. MIT 21-1697]|uniref:DUF2972 domain-containing protein n=1 Tax=Helicobacter sp. MIT 21-1697 TaxID=2993733 RepID=UPI00224AAE3C|nr:DUF2972 domain-containing protein [Helicobacter sp. MIT 21-1697]MCX2716640.1 DUF2972 domain-containing protein [Helicobacter sp. MIT 21-1697]